MAVFETSNDMPDAQPLVSECSHILDIRTCRIFTINTVQINLTASDKAGVLRIIYFWTPECACSAFRAGSLTLSETSSVPAYFMGEQRWLRRDCASAQSRLNHRCSHIRQSFPPFLRVAIHMTATRSNSTNTSM